MKQLNTILYKPVKQLITIILLFCFQVCYAQKQNNNWCFPSKKGLNFNATPFTVFFTGVIGTENCASVSDPSTGALLFYVNADKIWDRTNTLLPNGANIGQDAAGTCAQGSVIVPSPKGAGKYYVFTVGHEVQSGELRYSEIDMSLNGGLGDVVTATKNTLLDTGFTEGMTCAGMCGAMWIVVLKRNSNIVYAYEISSTGVKAAPVISKMSYPPLPDNISYLKVSPNMERLAIVCYAKPGHTSSVTLQDFDMATGKVINGMVIDTGQARSFYSAEFSPDNSKLYVGAVQPGKLYQYDISLDTPALITASRQTLMPPASLSLIGGIQIGPDSNVYVAIYLDSVLGKITAPNTTTPVFTKSAVNMHGGFVGLSLPQAVPLLGIQPVMGTNTSIQMTYCFKSPHSLAGRQATNYYWQDGSRKPSFSINQPGVYWVRSIKDCVIATDTFTVKEVLLDASLGNDTFICDADTFLLHPPTQLPGTTYMWSTGSTDTAIQVAQKGEYELTIQYDNCTMKDRIAITDVRTPTLQMGSDEELCNGEVRLLPYIGPVGDTVKYLWQDGSTGATYNATRSGVYTLQVTNKCNKVVTGSVKLDFRNCNINFPNAFTPNGDGLNDIAHLLGTLEDISNFSIRISNRYGQAVYESTNVKDGWNGKFKSQPQPVGVYYYIINYTYRNKQQVMKGDITLVR